MKKVTKETVTRVSAIQKFEAYKASALEFIARLRYPNTQSFFSVTGYEKTPTGVKPNVINVPELLAIVGTANKLGKRVEIRTSGAEKGGQIDVVLVDSIPSIPNELRY